jgi:hypothetical protein
LWVVGYGFQVAGVSPAAGLKPPYVLTPDTRHLTNKPDRTTINND